MTRDHTETSLHRFLLFSRTISAIIGQISRQRSTKVDNILVKIVIILAATKILGILSRKLKMPEVLEHLLPALF